MTEEEQLKQEAEENSFRYTLDKPWVCEVERKQIMAHFEKGYLAGAEPREKRIEDLEKENAELKSRECWKSCEYANPKSELIAQHIKDVQQLTKAKEYITEFMRISVASVEEYEPEFSELIGKAEQFIKEIEK